MCFDTVFLLQLYSCISGLVVRVKFSSLHLLIYLCSNIFSVTGSNMNEASSWILLKFTASHRICNVVCSTQQVDWCYGTLRTRLYEWDRREYYFGCITSHPTLHTKIDRWRNLKRWKKENERRDVAVTSTGSVRWTRSWIRSITTIQDILMARGRGGGISAVGYDFCYILKS